MNDLTFANHCNEGNWQVFLFSNVKTKRVFLGNVERYNSSQGWVLPLRLCKEATNIF